MRSVGNTASNRALNPRNVKPSIPLDPDEVDGAMEKFIRQKHQHKKLAGGDAPAPSSTHNTGSTGSLDDRPPPPPPKPLARFGPGLRAASSTFPSALVGGLPSPAQPSRLGWNEDMPGTNGFNGRTTRGRRRSSFDGKLVHLRQIGFKDGERNLTVLKEVDGDVQRAIEVLRRFAAGQHNGAGAGFTRFSVDGAREAAPIGESSLNPYQRQDRPQLSTVNSAAFEQNQVLSLQTPYNPFDVPTQTPFLLDTSLQNLQITQHLNHTGSWPLDSQQHNPFLKTFTPPISPSPMQYQQMRPFQSSADFSSSQVSTPQSSTNTNPFFRQQIQPQPQPAASTNPFEQAQAGQIAEAQATRAPQFQAQVIPEWTQAAPEWTQAAYSQTPGPAHAPYPTVHPQVQSPFEEQPLQHSSPYPQSYQTPGYFEQPLPNPGYPFSQPNTQAQYQITSQPSTPFRDKGSILALYSQPYLAPPQAGTLPPEQQTTAGQDAPSGHTKRRSVTLPASLNPFASLTKAVPGQASKGAAAAAAAAASEAQKPEAAEQRWSGHGRWSPDAFAGLSARVGGGGQ